MKVIAYPPLWTIRVNSADQFVDWLRPSKPSWWDRATSRRTHVFRGQADSRWGLVPHGLRPLGPSNSLTGLFYEVERARSKYGSSPNGRTWHYALAEATTQFVSLGRQIGLEASWNVPHSVLTKEGLGFSAPEHDLGLLALAQHHGVPTSLLDWSEDPLTAAFFALGDSDLDAPELAVWALASQPTIYRPAALLSSNGYQGHILLDQSATAGNSKIRAQSGVFLHYESHAMLRFHDELNVAGHWRGFETFPEVQANLLKITLPRTQRDALQRILLAEGRSAAHLMPSWDKAAETLLQRWKRDER